VIVVHWHESLSVEPYAASFIDWLFELVSELEDDPMELS
jgi:hypothetical protein